MTLSITAKRRQKSALEDDAADRRLQIEADQRDLARDRLAMGDDLVLGGRFHRGEAEQAGVIADAARGLRLRHGLSASGRRGPRPAPAAAWSSPPRSRRRVPAPADRGRRRGSRIAWCGRRPQARRRRRRCSSASARADARRSSLRSASSASGWAGITVPVGDQAPHLGCRFGCGAWPSPIHIRGRRRRRQLRGLRGGVGRSACAGTAARSFQPEPVRPLRNARLLATASISSGPVSDAHDFIDQRQRLIRLSAKNGPICRAVAAVADQRERVAVRHQPRTGAAAEFAQQGACDQSPWRRCRARRISSRSMDEATVAPRPWSKSHAPAATAAAAASA